MTEADKILKELAGSHWLLDESGQVVPCGTFAQWCKVHPSQKRVAHHVVGNMTISTIFLGHDYLGGGRFFETSVFGEDDEQTYHWPTLRDALCGHASVVASTGFPDSCSVKAS